MSDVSIIMPVYNKEQYILNSLKSVINQSFKDWELIIINDGSTDGSLDIINSLHDNRIRTYTIENHGVSYARNYGLAKAHGKYITFLDADDYIDKDFLQNIYDPTQEMVIGGLTKVDKIGNKSIIKVPFNGIKTIDEIFPLFYDLQIKSGIFGFISTKLIKLSIIKENKIKFNESIKLAEDLDFFISVYNCVKYIKFIDYNGYYYVQNTLNSGINVSDEKIDFFQQSVIQKKIKDFLNSRQSFSLEDEQNYNKIVNDYLYTLILYGYKNGYNIFKKNLNKFYEVHGNLELNDNFLRKFVVNLYNHKKYWLLYSFSKIHSLF